MGDLNRQMGKTNNRIDFLELQFKNMELQIINTESNLKNDIQNTERIILDEVERIHTILNKHVANPKAHSA
ncbi:hypothetical protein DXA36_06375 [Eisenbergiella sp. OF01-20]|nr:hypothetical protein [Lachnospiraceae bacterium]RHP90877.1 hypothetical protein DXA36_06375 [Eisenbergiella sp. OF01-20]